MLKSPSSKIYLLIGLVLLLLPCLVACGDSPSPVPASTPTAAATPTTVAAATTLVAPTPGTVAPTTLAATTVESTRTIEPTDAVPDIHAEVDTLMNTVSFQTFTSTKGMFSIALPDQPYTDSVTESLGEGPIIEDWFTLRIPVAKKDYGDIVFIASSTAYPAALVTSIGPAGLVKRELNGLTRSREVDNLKDIQLGDVSGKAFNFVVHDKVLGYGRVYVKGNRTYTLTVDNSYYLALPDDFKPFFDSFQILDNMTGTPAPANQTADDLKKIKLDQVFYDSWASKVNDATNVDIQFYTSDTDPEPLVKILNAEAVQKGYQEDELSKNSSKYGYFTKTGQPDLIFVTFYPPTDNDTTLYVWPSLDLQVNQAAITKMLAQVKDKKALVMILTGNGLVATVKKFSASNTVAPTVTPTATATVPHVPTPSGDTPDIAILHQLDELQVNAGLSYGLTKSIHNVDDRVVHLYTSDQSNQDISKQVDTSLKASGYTFDVPDATGPTLNDDKTFTGLYSKAGQPDVFFVTWSIATDDATRLAFFSRLDMSMSIAQQYADALKGKKSGLVLVTGTNLAKNMLNP